MPNCGSGRDIVLHTSSYKIGGRMAGGPHLEASLHHSLAMNSEHSVYVCGMYPCMYVCGGQRRMLGVFVYCFAPYFFETGNPISHPRLDWQARGVLPSQCLGYKHHRTQLFTWVLGISPHICVASTLPTELPLQLQNPHLTCVP